MRFAKTIKIFIDDIHRLNKEYKSIWAETFNQWTLSLKKNWMLKGSKINRKDLLQVWMKYLFALKW